MLEITLLPPSSTPLERAVDRSAAARLSALPAVVASLWHAATCPAPLLPYLAWALSVDEWDEEWGTDRKRAVIAESRPIHQQKGTPAALRRALTAIGQPDAVIVERGDYVFRNAAIVRDGSRHRAGQGGWATYRIFLSRPATIAQGLQIKRLMASVQRNCITLTGIDYRQSAHQRNGAIARNGAWARGVVGATI